MRNTENLIFMIEGGKALELVKAHIADIKLVRAAVKTMAQELGIDVGVTSIIDGRLLGVTFPGERHPDFKAPDREGTSYPKKNSEWAKRFAAAPGHQHPSEVISRELGIPLSLGYKRGTGEGWTCIGNPLNECGFLYLGENGPYAMWIPDVPTIVASMEAEGSQVEEPGKSFVPEFNGCRRIEQEEWDILVAQRNLEKKRKQSEGAM